MQGTVENKKILAHDLRQKGESYSEISNALGVSKSTLSYWLKDIKLSQDSQKKLEIKRIRAAQMGADVRHKQKIDRIKDIEAEASSELPKITNEEIWLIGIILYWAEGSKEKINGRSERVSFSNSDSRMLHLFKYWLTAIIKVPETDLIYELYIHENSDRLSEALSYWSKALSIKKTSFRVYYKKNQIKRREYKSEYFGLVRLKVRSSSNLNRKINGWIKAIYKSFYSRVV